MQNEKNKIEELFFESKAQIQTSKYKEYVYFRLQGRLGNQLLGLANAKVLADIHKKKILLDITEVLVDSGVPVWLDFIDISSWASIFNDKSESKFLSTQETIDMATYRKISEICSNQSYSGFSPSIEFIKASGIFPAGKSPFESTESYPRYDLAISIRGGDYNTNPHLGLIGSRYYKICLYKLDFANMQKVKVFTDDPKYASRIMSQLPVKDWEFASSIHLINVLVEIAAADYVIGANSTFSFWGAYFSNAKEVAFPWPFYLATPDWNKYLIQEGWHIVKYNRFPRLTYFSVLVRNKAKKMCR